jgi:hypothetical membrane protein
MKREYRFLFGTLAGIILGGGIVGLALLLPGYSHLRQTVSEIGEVGSPARIPFAVMLCVVGVCLLIFASAVREVLARAHHSQAAAYLIGCMALSAAGVGVYAHPHHLHNIFGLSELIGYQAPMALAVTWRGEEGAKRMIAISWVLYVVIMVAIALNLSPAMPSVWVHLKPLHGLLQRALFAAWFGWCAALSLSLYCRDREITRKLQ